MADNKLHTAVRYGNEEETLQALKEGFSPNEIGMLRWTPVHEAAQNGERDILKSLILYQGDVNQKDDLHGNTPLHYAAQEDNSACVTVLLNAGAKWDAKNDLGKTPLDVATSSCRERIEPFYILDISKDERLERVLMDGVMEGKRCRGRPRRRWIQDVTDWLGVSVVEANCMTQNRTGYPAAVWEAPL